MKVKSLQWALALATAVTIGYGAPLQAQDEAAPSQAPAIKEAGKRGDGPRGGRHGGPRRGIAQRVDRFAERLGLDENQKQQIRVALEEDQKAVQPLREGLRTERAALEQVVQASPVDEVAIRAQAAKLAALEADVAVQRATVRGKVLALLTPEQRTQITAEPGALAPLLGGMSNVGGPRRSGPPREGRGGHHGPRGGGEKPSKEAVTPSEPASAEAGDGE